VQSIFRDLVVAIDVSEDGSRVVAVVGARVHVLNSRRFGRLCTGLKHFRRVSSDRKTGYLRSFAKKCFKLREVLDVVRIVWSVNDVINILSIYRPALVVIDDKLSRYINYEPKILESMPKPIYLDNLMTIADNLANYFRILLIKNPRKLREELRKFEK